MQHVTIKDIAKVLNVSVATVSRAFNDKYGIRKETREIILLKAKEMGYRPNPIARKLLQKQSFNIGVIVPEFINSFFPKIIMGVQDVLCEKNYQVIIMQSNESAELELKNLNTLQNHMVDGLLISLSKETKNIAHLEQLIQAQFPMVLFNRVNDSLPVPKIVFRDYKWALFATEHLIDQGYKKIYHLAGPMHLTLIKNRVRGFERAMEKHNIPFTEDQIIETGITIRDGEIAMEKILSEGHRPDAIFATNDPTALGAMKVLKKYNYKIPKDVGVIGFTSSNMAEIVEPNLSSVEQPTYEMGKRAAQLLLKQIESKNYNPLESITMDGKLIIRESSTRI